MTAPATWQAIETRLRPFVTSRVQPSDVDDVMQDIFVRMHRGLCGLRDEERFTSWLFQIARSSISEHARARFRHPLTSPAAAVLSTAVPGDLGGGAGPDSGALGTAGDPGGPAEPDDREAARALAGCVSIFVAQLPSPYREAVTLVELEGVTAREAAEMAGISLSGMKSRVQRGRTQLRAFFDQCCEIALDARGKVTDFVPRRPPTCACESP